MWTTPTLANSFAVASLEGAARPGCHHFGGDTQAPVADPENFGGGG